MLILTKAGGVHALLAMCILDGTGMGKHPQKRTFGSGVLDLCSVSSIFVLLSWRAIDLKGELARLERISMATCRLYGFLTRSCFRLLEFGSHN